MGEAEEGKSANQDMEALKRTMQYALIKNCDMNEEMRTDCVDAVISATEKCVLPGGKLLWPVLPGPPHAARRR